MPTFDTATNGSTLALPARTKAFQFTLWGGGGGSGGSDAGGTGGGGGDGSKIVGTAALTSFGQTVTCVVGGGGEGGNNGATGTGGGGGGASLNTGQAGAGGDAINRAVQTTINVTAGTNGTNKSGDEVWLS